MDLEEKIDLILRPPTEEIITIEELRELLQTNEHPVAYDGFEPSGMVHLGTGLICAYKMKDFIKAGIKFKVYLATWHAWINNKLGGDLDLIKKAAEHFKHSWIALGVPEDKVEFIFADEVYKDLDYWKKTILVAKNMTIARGKRTLEIMGRKESEGTKISDLLYTPMQVADIFQFDVNICQLGMDQRKANVVARELGKKIGFWKPICVHHHLLQGLVQPPVWPIPKDKEKEVLVSCKMSKSKPKTSVWIYDKPENIREKINNAFCPPKVIEYNPIIDICKHIIFREVEIFKIERPSKFGGTMEFHNFEELEKTYKEGKLHPLDLKNAVAEELIKILEPVRKYFEKNKKAKELLEVVEQAKITKINSQ